jgi:hypothetical protein
VNCNDFEATIDLYLDGMLEGDARRRATEHAGSCTACDALVTSYQQAASLLTTAVADRAAAVDVSGLWEAIDAAIGEIPVARPEPLRHPVQTPTPATGWGWRRWLPDWSPLTLGAAAAATLAVAIFFGGSTTENQPQRIARVKTKPVRIENLEVPSGYTVSTWSRPRTRTHIIAINQAPAYTLASASSR